MGDTDRNATHCNNQRSRILYVMKILLENTDEEHFISIQEIAKELSLYGIASERKSIRSDIENLCTYGLDIAEVKEGRNKYYHLVNREFELAELKLLVDAVQCSKFITVKQSNKLIQKLKCCGSKYQAGRLQRQVYVNGRLKSENEKSFYSVDAIYEAIAQNRKIVFRYFSYNEKKEKIMHHQGDNYIVSPWAMCWDDRNYYMIGHDEESDEIKHFRVDKMLETQIIRARRSGEEAFLRKFGNRSFEQYTEKLFGMYGGEIEQVKLLCPNSLANVIIDRFGKDIRILPNDHDSFTTTVEVAVSELFLGWVMALKKVRILEPESVVDRMKEMLKQQNDFYQ